MTHHIPQLVYQGSMKIMSVVRQTNQQRHTSVGLLQWMMTHFSRPTTVDDDTSLICDDGFWHSQRVYVDEQIVSIYTATVRVHTCIQLTTSDVVLSTALYMTRHQWVSSPRCTSFYYRTMLRAVLPRQIARPSVRFMSVRDGEVLWSHRLEFRAVNYFRSFTTYFITIP